MTATALRDQRPPRWAADVTLSTLSGPTCPRIIPSATRLWEGVPGGLGDAPSGSIATVSRPLIDVVRLGAGYLADHGVEGARLDAELLAAHALGLRRLDLYLQYDRPLDEAELAPLRELLRRRARGEPVAYITGERDFFGRSFAVTPAVLVPRPETELLVQRALAWAGDRDPLLAVDLGTGSGCIAVSLAAEALGIRALAVDASLAALQVARSNARRHGVADRVRLVAADWTAPLARQGRVDMLLSNPPYVTEEEAAGLMRDVRDFEPRGALVSGPTGLEAYAAILESAGTLLGRPGLVALEVDPRRAEAVAGLVAERLPGAAVEIHTDLAGHRRLVEATR